MISRREFLTVSLAAGGGLLLGFSTASQADAAPAGVVPAVASGKDFAPNAWVRIAPDGQITLVVSASEMGQGAMTALPMLIAEELDAEWGRFNTEFAPANQAYANPLLGGQITGGSATVRGFYTPGFGDQRVRRHTPLFGCRL